MKAKTVAESLSTSIEDILKEKVRQKNTLAKLLDYVKRVNEFSEDNQTIDKKELTRLMNDFGGTLRMKIFGTTDGGKAYDIDELALAKKAGYSDVYTATSIAKDPFFKIIQFNAVYDVYDILRKYEALRLAKGSAQKNFMNKWFPNLKLWAEFAQKVIAIKEILLPTKEQKQAQQLKKIKGAVNPEIKKAIDEIAESFRQYIEDKEYDWAIGIGESFEKHYPNGADEKEYNDKKNRAYFRYVGPFLKRTQDTYGNNRMYNIIPDLETKARSRAILISQETIKAWQLKMYNKLGGFISDLNKKFKTFVTGDRMGYNRITFKFDDGSNFTLQNQIVGKQSHLGNYFYAYPSTFHNAYLPDGSKIANPNEFTVKNAFNNYK